MPFKIYSRLNVLFQRQLTNDSQFELSNAVLESQWRCKSFQFMQPCSENLNAIISFAVAFGRLVKIVMPETMQIKNWYT